MAGSRLGKGLEFLFKQKEIDSSFVFEERYQNIPLDLIEPNPFQPRKEFDQESLVRLANSIKHQGLIQPIVVRTSPSDEKRFQIVVGERRWRACKLIKTKTIPAVILDLSDEELMLVALIENLQREDLNPIEEAEALQKAQQLLKLSHEKLSQKIGKSRTFVTNSLRLLKLDEEIKDAIRRKEISVGQVRPLLGIDDKQTRLFLFKLIVEKGLSAREVERAVSFWKKNHRLPESLCKRENELKKKESKETNEFAQFKKELQKKLSSALNVPTKVIGSFDQGKIVLHYSSKEELKSLLERFKIV